MAQSCWYQSVELREMFTTTKRKSPRNISPINFQMESSKSNLYRQRSKSTSEGGLEDIDGVENYNYNISSRGRRSSRHNNNNNIRMNRYLSEILDVNGSSVELEPCNDIPVNNFDNPIRVPDCSGNILAGRRELIIGERIRNRTRTLSESDHSGGGGSGRSSRNRHHSSSSSSKNNSKYDSRITELINVVILTCVFVLGVVSAVFVIVCYKHGDFGMGPGRDRVRVELFQPFPEADQLAVIDEHYLDPVIPPWGDDSKEDNECDGENKLALELEAITSVRSALDKKDQGKHAKAQKLFQHAMMLCPRHPDVLTHYGEFYEETRQDYIRADHLYVQALTYSPRHTKALINRKRTLPVVEELDEKRLNRIDAKREQLLLLSETNRALRRIRKEAYFQQIYHSAGIEGNTMTLSQTRLIVETRMAVGGKSIIEHNEILGLDAALRFVNVTLVNRIGKITLQDILLIHKHLMGFVDPGDAGQLRTTQVFVGNHIPPQPLELLEQMSQLVEWLNSEEALSLHPIHYAAIAHYKLVYIHPFLDGNGRTSRLLMNWILMQANYPPVIIRKQDRMFYYEHLSTANAGDLRPFIRFVGDCTEKTMDVYLWATQTHSILELDDEHSDHKEIVN